MSDIKAFGKNKLYSRAVVHGGLVYLMGHVSDDKHVDVAVQTQQILDRIDESLAMAGSHKGKLLSATVWLAETSDYGAMNEVWEKWVSPENPPARSTAGANLISAGRKVVISGIAAL